MRSQYFSLLFLTFALLAMPAVSASISISQPNALYNLGDDFSVQLTVDSLQENYLDVDIACSVAGANASRINIYHGILSEKIIQLDRKLIPVHISGLYGTCYISASYGSDSQTSQVFEISREIKVDLEPGALSYNAGDAVTVKGKAVKENSGLVSGYADVRIGNESKASGIVSNGQFEINFTISEATPGGTSTLIVEVYDKDSSGNVLNSGDGRADLIIIQKPDYIEIAIDKELAVPGDSLKIIPILYDKARYEMPGEELLMKIQDSNGKIAFEKIVHSQEEITFALEYNHAPGHSSIIVEKEVGEGEELIISEQVFDVAIAPKIKVEVEEGGGNLIITNIGNTKYDKTIEINIGGQTFLKKIVLAEGESQRYKLEAPDGEYNLVVKDEYGTLHEGSVALTGRAISVKEAGKGIGLLARYPLVWMFIILVLGMVLFVMYKNHKKKREYSFPVAVSEKKPEKKKAAGREEKEKAGASGLKAVAGILGIGSNVVKPGAIKKAEHVLVVDGQKQNAGIVALRLKDEQISKFAKQALEKAFEAAYALKGVPCQIEDGFLLVFSPAVSKTMKNGEAAVKAAQKVELALSEYNRKFKEKIRFGLGVNVGEIINKVEGDVLKFTSIGPTINIAKKIAGIANNELLLSKDAHARTKSDVKVDIAIPESKANKTELFKVKRIIDNERNKQFIQEFLRKNF